jgi:hypothetical protein
MVRERILHAPGSFSIIRFDAAMVLARQHIRRLWYPAPGSGGAIPSRSDTRSTKPTSRGQSRGVLARSRWTNAP